MIDKNSQTWSEIAGWAERELSMARDRNDELGVGFAETENLRGRIACLKGLLALRDDIDLRVVEPTQDYGFQGVDEA